MCTTVAIEISAAAGIVCIEGNRGVIVRQKVGRAAWQRSRDCRGVVAWDTPNSAQLGCGTHLTLELTNLGTKFPTTGLVFVMGHFTGHSEVHASRLTIFVMRCCATFKNSLVYIEGASRGTKRGSSVHFRAASSQPSISDTKVGVSDPCRGAPGDTRSTSHYAFSVWLFCSEHSRL
jgi:hypothetical protein